MKISVLLLASTALAGLCLADDQLRDVQSALKSEGFYYGEVDGKNGAETSSAIRRFQIRNGLKITGELNAETLAALEISPAGEVPKARPDGGSPASKPPIQFNPDSPSKKRSDLLRETPGGEPGLRPRRPLDDEDGTRSDETPRRTYPDDPAVVEPPTPVPGATYDEFTTFYHGTPYVDAPREVQVDIARKAQTVLARRGLYRGRADGLPGVATADALFAYQELRRLTRTGRLDLRTLADLDLLPGRGPELPPMRPFRDPSRGRDRGVDYRGIIR